MRNIAMRLMYDGTNYHGWQVQKTDKTVAGTLEETLSRLTGERVKLTGCGRTDAGVHASCYCANFRSATSIPNERLPLAVNTLLPEDIAVTAAVDAPEDFNAILSCIKKEYTYRIINSRIRDPFSRSRAYFYPVPLKPDIMRAAARQFVGTHDFAAVRSVGTETKTTVRTIYYCDIEQSGQEISMRVCADGFLYNMVRAIMGTVIYCSEGKLSPGDIPSILETRDRRLTGPTVPPQGLYLTRVWYDGAVGEMMS
ncbi:MAG: tRNA pseudouridine(38-40) synthase TruA [Oscillospiraceae bacterium]